MPEFTVIIAVRDEVKTLPACLDAIEGQDFDRAEVETLVVDGGSTDGCDDLVAARGLPLLRDGGSGPGAARNIGLRAARGDIIAFTDADCIPRFDWLSRLSAAFRDPAIHGVAGGMRMPRETLLGRMEDNDARQYYSGYVTANVAYRREVLLDVGGFDEGLRCAEDYDLAWRVLDAGYRIEHVPTALVLHDQPEVGQDLRTYLAKQFWYARCDVATQARAMARGTSVGTPLARGGFRSSLWNSAALVGAVAGLALRSPAIVATALGMTSFTSARHVVGAATDAGGEVVPMVAVEAMRRLVRGAGTLAGLASLGLPDIRRSLRAPSPVLSGPVEPLVVPRA